MKSILCAAALVGSLLSFDGHAQNKKHISERLGIDTQKALTIDFPVGSLELETTTGDEIILDIELEAKKDGWFAGDNDISDIELKTKISKTEVSLKIDDDDLNQAWVLKVPQSLMLDIDVGVGNIALSQLKNSAELEVGVGSINITLTDDFKHIELESGVGETSIKGLSGKVENKRNVVTSESRYHGKGTFSIDAEVGVGDITVRK